MRWSHDLALLDVWLNLTKQTILTIQVEIPEEEEKTSILLNVPF